MGLGMYSLGGVVVLAQDIWATINIFQSSVDNGKKSAMDAAGRAFPRHRVDHMGAGRTSRQQGMKRGAAWHTRPRLPVRPIPDIPW